MNFFQTLLYNFGLFSSLIVPVLIIWRICLSIWRNYFKQGAQWCGGPNIWAVVSGATDGIGLEYARQLAEKNYNLLLLSRNLQKLNNVKNEIMAEHKTCRVRVLAVDFTSVDIYERIEEELKKLTEVHVLVNNVGIDHPDGRIYFTKILNLNQFIPDIINVNIMACTRLTALILPRMEEKHRGIIINVSSASAVFPIPFFSIYSASKAYMDFLSRTLNQEYNDKGIIVQSLVPGVVTTKLSTQNRNLQPFIPDPQQFVKSALKTVGKFDRCPGHIYFAFDFTTLLNLLSNLLGVDFGPWIIGRLFKIKFVQLLFFNKNF